MTGPSLRAVHLDWLQRPPLGLVEALHVSGSGVGLVTVQRVCASASFCRTPHTWPMHEHTEAAARRTICRTARSSNRERWSGA